MKQVIKVVNWLLFGISVALFMVSVYNAVQGRVLDLTAEVRGIVPGALIVAGIATTTWIINGAALYFRVIESGSLEWYGTAALAIIAFAIDILVMAAFAFGLHVPPNLPLFVVMGHAGLHFGLWIATAYEVERRDGGLLTAAYKPLDQQLAELSQQVAGLSARAEQAESRLEDAKSQHAASFKQLESQHKASIEQLERQLEQANERADRIREEANRTYDASCEYCGETYHKPSQLQADNAVKGHKLHCKKKPENQPSTNGHKPQMEVLK